ncbi:MAG: sensor histidine kinase [Muribaculaceae bacterium]|nr:sensor histidine kinase [Muribaculaceae bacterium]
MRRQPLKKTVTMVFVHLLAIFSMLILPELVMNLADTMNTSIPIGVYVQITMSLIVFYANYLFLFDYCFGTPKKGVLTFCAFNLVLFIIAVGANYLTWELVASDKPIHGAGGPPGSEEAGMFQPGEVGFWAMAVTRMLRDAVMLVMTVGFCVAVKFSMKWSADERQKQEELAKQREDELEELRSQINPHFLFNTLNNIYALIDISPERSKKAVHTLGKMMRYLLYETNADVTVGKEIEFVRCYIEMMKMRLGDRVPLNVVLDDGCQGNLKIAPVLFTTVVENVFKHGNTGDSDHPMDISIVVKDGVVCCETFNYRKANSESSEGIGLENLHRRLELLYGPEASLQIEKTDKTFAVRMEINLNRK